MDNDHDGVVTHTPTDKLPTDTNAGGAGGLEAMSEDYRSKARRWQRLTSRAVNKSGNPYHQHTAQTDC